MLVYITLKEGVLFTGPPAFYFYCIRILQFKNLQHIVAQKNKIWI